MNIKQILAVIVSVVLLGAVSCKKAKSTEPENAPKKQAAPQRIVSLSPAATEIVCAVGAADKLVARSDFCDYPPEVKNLPSAGGFDGKTISLETLLAFSPDFVYMTKGMHDFLAQPLESRGIRTYLSEADSVQSVFDEILEIGQITGNQKKADELCKKIADEIETLRSSAYAEERPPVYWEIWNAPYMSVGGKSFLNELISIAGGKNIFSEVQQTYPVVNDEAIIAANPKVIFISDAYKNGGEAIKARNGWQKIDAVKNGQIFSLNADIISRPGPRIAQAAELLHQKIHARNEKADSEE